MHPSPEWTADDRGRGGDHARRGRTSFQPLRPHTRRTPAPVARADTAARSTSVATAIAAEAPRFMQVVARLAYSDALPRAAHRASSTRARAPRDDRRTCACRRCPNGSRTVPEIAALDEALQIFLFDQLVIEMDAALQKASASVRNPVLAHEEWSCVGVSKGLVWVDPLWAGPDGTGHVFMYEFPRAGLSRRDRKTLESAIAEMSASVSSLTKLQRNAMVRAASAVLTAA